MPLNKDGVELGALKLKVEDGGVWIFSELG